MTLSAKRLGERCGLTAEEMNILLKEEGFLSGEPGNYYTTEKGKLFVVEKGDDNGYGGYAFRGWNWFEWDERILEELDTSVENKRYIREKTYVMTEVVLVKGALSHLIWLIWRYQIFHLLYMTQT